MLGAKSYTDILSNYIKAGSQSCSPQLLAELAHSEVDRIRLRVAENPRTPVDILELLACDKNADVRIAAGTNPSTPMHISYSLAFDEDPNVRLGLAEDINTPVELLDKLMEDDNPYVSCRAGQTKELILSHNQPRDFGCHRFFRWASKGADQPELRYA
jgi:hypothetical protein